MFLIGDLYIPSVSKNLGDFCLHFCTFGVYLFITNCTSYSYNSADGPY